MAASNIGMMDGAYFVGRNEILAWINTTLQLGLSKVEEVSDARVSCSRSPRCGAGGFSDLRGGCSVCIGWGWVGSARGESLRG
jgi:hypothetical protein